jgi:hypothetical protein
MSSRIFWSDRLRNRESTGEIGVCGPRSCCVHTFRTLEFDQIKVFILLIAFNSSRKSFFRFAGVRGAPSRSAQRQGRHPSQSWKADTFVCARTPANASVRTPAHQRILKLQTAFDLRQNLTKSSCDRKQNSIISVEIFSFYATNGRLQKKRVCASTGRFAEDAFLRVIESLTIKNQG